MPANRRQFLRVLGGGSIILAASAGWWATSREPSAAYAPWSQAGKLYQDPMRNALSYAILAPNPHNRQPWLVALHSETQATLYCQLDRRLPETDPLNRQITVGLGCFLEILRIAAAQFGYRAEIIPFPEGEDTQKLDHRPIARLTLIEDSQTPQDPLFAHILNRHTDRAPYDTSRKISAAPLQEILRQADGQPALTLTSITDQNMLSTLRKLSWEAFALETATPAKHGESIALTRIGKKEILANPDGISLSGAAMEAMAITGLVSRQKLKTPGSAYDQTLEHLKPAFDTAMGYIIIATEGNDRIAQLSAGRAYVRTHLAATAHKISMHPLSQALQEYEEMAPLFSKVHNLLAKPGQTLQMLARIGYGAGAKTSPRWPLETRIKS